MSSNEQLLLECVADILFKMIKEHPELCPHDYQGIGVITNADFNMEGYVKPIRCKDCRSFTPYKKPVEDFDGRCFIHRCETDEEEYCSYGVAIVNDK